VPSSVVSTVAPLGSRNLVLALRLVVIDGPSFGSPMA
jgi:hypothetical protein